MKEHAHQTITRQREIAGERMEEQERLQECLIKKAGGEGGAQSTIHGIACQFVFTYPIVFAAALKSQSRDLSA